MDKQNTGVVSLLELHTKTAMELARFKLLIRSERFKDSSAAPRWLVSHLFEAIFKPSGVNMEPN